jgi:GWxTD domain-containing protein
VSGRGKRALLGALLLSAAAGAEPVFLLDTATRFAPGSAIDRHLEILLSVEREALAWTPVEDGLAAGYRARLVLSRGETLAADTSWERRDWRPADENPVPGRKIPDLIEVPLPAGLWRLTLRLQDLVDGEARERSLRLDEAAAGDSLLSAPRLSVLAPEPAAEGPFRIDGWRLVPYADALYGSGLPMLHGWVQLRGDELPEPAWLALRVLGEMQNPLLSRPRQAVDSLRLAGSNPPLLPISLDVSGLASGVYFLEIELQAGDGYRSLGSVRRSFWMENPGVQAPSRDLISDEYDRYGAEELAGLWDASQAIASWSEREAWERLDLPGRRAFLREFWSRRDPDHSTAMNEAKVRLLALLEAAKQRFSEPGRSGHLSDRGRILLSYGEPDAVETDYSSLNARFDFELSRWQRSTGRGSSFETSRGGGDHRDFELWVYERLEGGAVFIFVDVQGFGSYELVHSTKSGEYFDPNWGRKLFP